MLVEYIVKIKVNIGILYRLFLGWIFQRVVGQDIDNILVNGFYCFVLVYILVKVNERFC